MKSAHEYETKNLHIIQEHRAPISLYASYPDNSFTIIVITLKRIRGSLKN